MTVHANGLRPILTTNKIATEALAAYRIVIISTDPLACEYPAGATDTQFLGITMHAAALGENVMVMTLGECFLEVNAASPNIAWGDPIGAPDADGKGAKASATADVTSETIGKAIGAATADDVCIPVFVFPGWYATESS